MLAISLKDISKLKDEYYELYNKKNTETLRKKLRKNINARRKSFYTAIIGIWLLLLCLITLVLL